jgi:hypothetical protein
LAEDENAASVPQDQKTSTQIYMWDQEAKKQVRKQFFFSRFFIFIVFVKTAVLTTSLLVGQGVHKRI